MAEHIRRRPHAEPVPVTHEIALTVDSFVPELNRVMAPTGERKPWTFITLGVSSDPESPTPPPYDQRSFFFTLEFVDGVPTSLDDDRGRLLGLYLPITEFPIWMLTLSAAPSSLFLSVNLTRSVIVEAFLQSGRPRKDS